MVLSALGGWRGKRISNPSAFRPVEIAWRVHVSPRWSDVLWKTLGHASAAMTPDVCADLFDDDLDVSR